MGEESFDFGGLRGGKLHLQAAAENEGAGDSLPGGDGEVMGANQIN